MSYFTPFDHPNLDSRGIPTRGSVWKRAVWWVSNKPELVMSPMTGVRVFSRTNWNGRKFQFNVLSTSRQGYGNYAFFSERDIRRNVAIKRVHVVNL